MIPAFGFSIGDFIATIGLITKLVQALDERAGASQEYQQVQKMSKFESSMSAFPKSGSNPLKTFGRKSQRAVLMNEEVAKLRTAIGAKVLSINLLIANQTSESIAGFRSETRTQHVALTESILQQRTALMNIGQQTTDVRDTVEKLAQEQADSTKELDTKVDQMKSTVRRISVAADSTNTQLVSFRALGAQLLHPLQHLPKQIRETMEQIMRTDLEMYAMLRTIHAEILRSPAYDVSDLIWFEDALGRTRKFPYEYFRHKEVLESFPRADFKGLPGEIVVNQKQYIIMDVQSRSGTGYSLDWTRAVFPGSRLVMSVLAAQVGIQPIINFSRSCWDDKKFHGRPQLVHYQISGFTHYVTKTRVADRTECIRELRVELPVHDCYPYRKRPLVDSASNGTAADIAALRMFHVLVVFWQ